MKEAFKEMGVSFMAYKQAALVLKPADRAFNLPAIEISPQSTAVLAIRPLSSAAMRSDLFNPATCQSISQPIGIGRLVVQQSFGAFRCHSHIHKSFNRIDLSVLS